MQGFIDSYDEASGEGVVVSDAGERFTFARAALEDFETVDVGRVVLFVHDGARITQAVPKQGFWNSGPARRKAYSELRQEGPNIFGYFLRCLALYVGFWGRAQRIELWSFIAVRLLVDFWLIVIVVGAQTIGLRMPIELAVTNYAWIQGSVVAFFILPTVALVFRRLHDAGLSAWTLLLLIVPVLGLLFVVIAVTTLPSQRHDNRYGRHPRAIPLPA